MNNILHFTLLDFKQLMKSKTFYLKLLLFPMLLILLLSKALGGSNSTISSFSLAVCNEDLGAEDGNRTITFGKVLENEVLKSKDAASLFRLVPVTSRKEGIQLVRNKKASVFVYIPKDFTNALLQQRQNGIVITGNSGTSVDKLIVTGILEGFLRNTQVVLKEEKTFNTLLGASGKTSVTMDEMKKQLDASYPATLPEVSTSSRAVPVSAMQYVSIAMVVLFSISTVFTLVHKVVEEKLNHTLFRIKSTPARQFQYVSGKLCSIIFTLTLQMSAVILLSRLVFGMKWGNPWLILITTLVYAFSIGSPILMWGLLARDQNAVSSLASPILYGFGFLGGSFISSDALPKGLQSIQNIIPNGKALNCYLFLCEGKGLAAVYSNLLQLFLMGVLFLILTMFIYRGKEIIRHGNTDINKKAIKASLL
ncbi:ABC-2 type transport system permease protein [Anaerocolumna jejuensis DSM 15929]|uniref:ABC-2 type transport system permease protein n=1 Tax=Anaerocolumna jejuensis DSM 15929 TaxID=1121322 RepID=A0A1M7CQD0_9FIRM|nr:ABC transporter permease [Anaerocolumna jejuensis]SHL69471.1 ABC-2 type transport system permease protein [Anaerocolumna jejuensis DSM 15929]